MGDRIRVKVQAGGIEIEVEALAGEIDASLGLLDQVIAKFPPAQSEAQREPAATTPITVPAPRSDLAPPVTASKLRDGLMQLLNSDWGRVPRTLREISEALEVSAKHYSLPTISTALARMTKAGETRRLKKGDVYSYVSAKR